MPEPVLPSGYGSRPPAMDDLAATLAMLNHSDRRLAGCDFHHESVLRGFWTHPDLTLDRDVRIVLDAAGTVVGNVQVWNAPPHVQTRVFARVHPDHRGRGIGTALMTWAEALARERLDDAPPGARVMLFTWHLGGNDAAAALLAGHGIDCNRHSLNMMIELDEPVPPPRWPEGVELRPFDPGQTRDLLAASRDAFRDHYGEVERDFESDLERYLHWTRSNPRWDPSLIFVAWDGDAIAGVEECWRESDEDPEMGWIADLGVRRPWRRRGLATALLRHAFAELKTRGCRRAGLGVDASSLTGATTLYENVGMRTYRVYDEYEKELRPGDELRTVQTPSPSGS